jgi:hypothetical protein
VSRALARPVVRGALVGLACGLLGWALAVQPVGRRVEEWVQDAGFVDRGARPSATRVIVVAIDNFSLRPRSGFVLRLCIRKADEAWGKAALTEGLADTRFCIRRSGHGEHLEGRPPVSADRCPLGIPDPAAGAGASRLRHVRWPRLREAGPDNLNASV